jgi:tRNA(Ile)-lysidine synthase
MKGTKLISDLLTDLKKNLFEKQQQLVIEDAKGNIIWVVGIRTDDRFKIDSKTTNILKVEII